MPVQVTCTCGKTLRAKEEHAGKRARCPACGRIVTIPGTPSSAYDVFVSHSKDDKPTAEAICAKLESHGIRCWIAPRDITPGKEWGEAIIDGINQCRVMVLVFSSNSNRSSQVSREIERAVAKGLVLVPFRIEDVPLSKTMEYFLSSPHWLDAMTPPLEKHLEALSRTVSCLLSQGSERAPPSIALAALPSTVATETPPSMRQPVFGASVRAIIRRKPAVAAGVVVVMVLLVSLCAYVLWHGKPTGGPQQGEAAIALSGDQTREMPLSGPPPITNPGQFDGTQSKGASSSHLSEPTRAAIGPDLELQGGRLMYRSEGLSVRAKAIKVWRDKQETGAFETRLIVVSNRHDLALDRRDLEDMAELSFQINNQSSETVMLSQLQVVLLGVIRCYEDQIARPPLPPHVCNKISDLNVERASPPKEVEVDLDRVFVDLWPERDSTPQQELEYKVIENTNPNLVTASINAHRKLSLGVGARSESVAEITVAATDHFGQSGTCRFHAEATPKGWTLTQKTFSPPSDDPFASSEPVRRPERLLQVEEKAISLGTVAFAYVLKPGDLVATCGSGNLLREGGKEVLPPNSVKSFSLRLVCWTDNKVATSDTPKDWLIGLTDGRRRLSVSQPELVETHHLLALSVHANSTTGSSQDLCSDAVYQLVSTPRTHYSESVLTAIDKGSQHPFDSAARGIILSLAKKYEETAAYSRARLCSAIPASFDASGISLFCYYGDPTSPFRIGQQPNAASASVRQPRSNLIDFVAAVEADDNPICRLIHRQVVQLNSDKAGEALGKAKVWATELSGKRRSRACEQSFVRLETLEMPAIPDKPMKPSRGEKTTPVAPGDDPFGTPPAPTTSDKPIKPAGAPKTTVSEEFR